MKTQLACCAVMLSLATSADAAPAWCEPVEGKLMHGNLRDALTSPDPRVALRSIIDVLCHARQGSEEFAKIPEVEVARQRMLKRLGMTEADWPDAAAWAAEHQGRLMSTWLDYDRKKAWSALTPIEHFAAITKFDPDTSYTADIFGHQLSEVGRFGYIADCISRDNVVGWAVCQADIELLDRVKLRNELRTSAGSSAYERMALRIDLFELEPKLVAHAAKVKETIAKDPAYATVFATAAAGRKRWSATDANLVETMLAMDDARITNSRRAYAGCGEKTWSALRAAIAAIPAKTFAAASDVQMFRPLDRVAGIIANEPNGYLAALAYVMCKHDAGDGLTGALSQAMARWPGYRGPRTMAVSAVMNAGIELDDRDAKLEFPSTSRNWIGGRGASTAAGEGIVTAVKVTGEQATITFAKKPATGQRCTDWKTSNRIVMIRSDGTLVYDSTCLAYHKFTYDTAPKPQTVPAQYAEGLVPGMFATISDGVVIARATAAAKQPSRIAGVAVR